MLEERRGELAEEEGEDEGSREKAAVGEAGRAAGDGRRRRRAEVAGAARAGGRQARRAPHPCPSPPPTPKADEMEIDPLFSSKEKDPLFLSSGRYPSLSDVDQR